MRGAFGGQPLGLLGSRRWTDEDRPTGTGPSVLGPPVRGEAGTELVQQQPAGDGAGGPPGKALHQSPSSHHCQRRRGTGPEGLQSTQRCEMAPLWLGAVHHVGATAPR